MPISPLATFGFPQATPGVHKNLGYAYIRSPAAHPYIRPTPIFKENSKPALKLEESAYSVYYPCTPTARGWFGRGGYVQWLPDPTGETVTGYQRFMEQRAVAAGWIVRVLRLVVGRLKFPAFLNAHLEPPKSKFPLIIFSHGLAGTSTTYSQYCQALASEGYVVLAVEHRDGSGPSVMLPTEGEDGTKDRQPMHYVQHEGLSWADGESSSLTQFRTLQLEMRIKEVYEAYESFRQLIGSTNTDTTDIGDLPDSGKAEWISSFRDKVDCQDLYLTGHSFGGATILELLNNPPPGAFNHLPVKKVVTLDPWLDPVPIPSVTPEAYPGMPKLLVINSFGFTMWGVHFARLMNMVQQADGNLMTILGINLESEIDQSFSDFPLLMPTGLSIALGHLERIHELSSAFVKGTLLETPSVKGKEPDGGQYTRAEDGKMGADGSVVVHLLASQE